MAHFLTSPEEPYIAFDRGIDREDARSDIQKGGYDDAENILLRCNPQGGVHVCAMNVDQKLDPLITWQPGNAIFVAPYTFATFSAGVLSFSTHLVIARASTDVSVWRYDSGAPGTETLIRRGFNANKYWTHAVYQQFLITLNGRDAPMKYGQHFLGQGEARDRKSTRLNSSHTVISYAVFCLKKKKKKQDIGTCTPETKHSNQLLVYNLSPQEPKYINSM